MGADPALDTEEMKRDEAAEPETEHGSNHLLSRNPYSFTAGLTMEL